MCESLCNVLEGVVLEQPSKLHNDIFVSYAYADDDETKPGDPNSRWVSTFTVVLFRLLRQTLNRDPILFFDRAHITGNFQIARQLQEEATSSELFLAILSPRYVESNWCRDELAAFGHQEGRIFLVCRSPVPAELSLPLVKGLIPYKFHVEDLLTGQSRTFGVPTLEHHQTEYYDTLHSLVRDLSSHLRKTARLVGNDRGSRINVPPGASLAAVVAPTVQKPVIAMSAPFGDPLYQEWLFRIYHTEVLQMLTDTSILVQGKSRSAAERHPSFVALAGEQRLVSEADERLSATHRLGLSSGTAAVSEQMKARPLSFAISPAHLGAIVLLTYLRDVLEQPIKIVFRFPHSVEIGRLAERNSFPEPVHAISVTLSTAASLLQRAPHGVFRPHMMLPGMSHGVVAKRNAVQPASLSKGCYVFMKDPPSSEAFLYEDLLQKHYIRRSRVGTESLEPDHVTMELAAGRSELRALLGFPHYHFQERFNQCEILNNPYDPLFRKEVILFVHQDILGNWDYAQALSGTLRDAWLTLLEDAAQCRRLVGVILRDVEYARVMSRSMGLHHLRSLHDLGIS